MGMFDKIEKNNLLLVKMGSSYMSIELEVMNFFEKEGYNFFSYNSKKDIINTFFSIDNVTTLPHFLIDIESQTLLFFEEITDYYEIYEIVKYKYNFKDFEEIKFFELRNYLTHHKSLERIK